MKKIKEQKWKLLIGLLIIPVAYILLLTIIGAIMTIFKDSDFTFNLLNYWKTAFSSFYCWFIAFLLSILMYFYYSYKICFNKKKEATLKATKQNNFGSANWLSEKQLNSNYPLVSYHEKYSYHGFVVNSKKIKQELVFNIRTDTHNLIIGGTGSGKTQNLVLPTIAINAKSQIKPSMIITDPKGELYQYQKELLKTADYHVQIINLRTVTESIAWNPLQTIYDQFSTMLLSTNEQEKIAIRVAIQFERMLDSKQYEAMKPILISVINILENKEIPDDILNEMKLIVVDWTKALTGENIDWSKYTSIDKAIIGFIIKNVDIFKQLRK